MDKIVTGTIFGGYARVAVVNLKDGINEEIKIHNLSPLAAAALGRTMAAGAYLAMNLKNAEDSFSLSVKGDGPLGGVVVAGSGNGTLRGYVANPYAELPLKGNGHLDVGGGVGKGFLTVIKDLGLKEPYVGKCELVNGEIGIDFAQYLLKSEGIPSAVALGVLVGSDGCIGGGGIIVEALPGINEDMLFMLEDIAGQFENASSLLAERTPEEIFDFYFGHLDAAKLGEEPIRIQCNCSLAKTEQALICVGEKECREIVAERGKIELHCHFCEKTYQYTEEDLNRIWISN